MMTRKAILIAMGVVLALAATPAWALYIETSYVGERITEELWTWGHEDNSRMTGDPLNSTVAWLAQVGPGAWDLHLTNASPVATSAPDDILQGVFFSLDERIEMAPRDRVGIPGGSGFLDDGDEDTLQGWAYRNDLATGDANPFNQVYGVTHGIANPGLDTFGPSDTFATLLDLGIGSQWPNHSPAGSYGIVSGETTEPPGPGTGYVNNSLVFRFNALGLVPDRHIDNVVFHYGTDANIIPEPATMTLLGLGLAGLGARHMRRRSKRG